MNVNLEVLNGHLKGEVYVMEPIGSEMLLSNNKVCEVKEGLHGLKQASGA